MGLEKANGKKISEYELETIDADKINLALKDIDKRLSLVEANLPEQTIFPMILATNSKKYKITNLDNKVEITEAPFMISDAIIDVEFNKKEMKLNEFYKLVSGSEIKPVTKRGKAFKLLAS